MNATPALRDLMAALDDLGWDEQVAFEASERADAPGDIDVGTEDRLRELGSQATPALLDELERQPGYVAWALRLSPLVSGDASAARARRHAGATDARVRFWAGEILGRHDA